QADLLQVVLTFGAAGGLPHLLDGRQQQADQDGDDGNDDEQLDERKGSASHGWFLARDPISINDDDEGRQRSRLSATRAGGETYDSATAERRRQRHNAHRRAVVGALVG